MQENYSSRDVLYSTETAPAHIHIRSDGIYHVEYKPNTYLDGAWDEELRQKIIELTGNVKLAVIYTAHEGLVVTREARENCRRTEEETPIFARAFVTTNIVYQILAEFYNQAYKPSIPFKVFSDMKTAIDWLKSVHGREHAGLSGATS